MKVVVKVSQHAHFTLMRINLNWFELSTPCYGCSRASASVSFCAWTNQRTVTHMALTNLKYQGFFFSLFNEFLWILCDNSPLFNTKLNSLHHKRISHNAINFTNPSTFCLCSCETGSTSSSTLAPWRCCPIHQLRCCLISWYTKARWNATLEDNLGDAQWPPWLLGPNLATTRLEWSKCACACACTIIWLMCRAMWQPRQYWWCLRDCKKHPANSCFQVCFALCAPWLQ